ncbi:ankyrin, partial [Rhizopus microsporus var. microsporus]
MKQLDRLLARDKDGKSLLHYACINNKIERARHMLEQGADVNAKDNHDWTPLHLACLHGHLDIVKLLIQQGAVVNMLGSEDMDTPLHQASKHGHKEIVLYLIKSSNADVNIKNKYNQNPYDV